MTMHDDPLNAAAPLDEQLVAYLDGELDVESSRRVEELLATDAEVRRRLQAMERTWDLLDDLDTAPAGGQFAQTTLEMVALAASKDIEHNVADAPRRRRRRLSIIGGSLFLAAIFGFFAVLLCVPDPNHRLLQDLSVLENLDEYRQVGQIEFLHMLRDEGLFAKDEGEVPAAMRPDESLADRRQRVEKMSPSDHARLVRLQERLADFDQDQRQQLQQLDETLQEAADAMQLRQIMHRYCQWLADLPLYTRAELIGEPPAKRLESVRRRLEDEQARDDRRRAIGKDMQTLLKWITEHADRHKTQLLRTMSESQRGRLAELRPATQRGMVFWHLLRRWKEAGPGKPPPMMTNDDLTRLRTQLNPKTREWLDSKTTTEQWQQVARWIRHVAWQRAATRTMHGFRSEAHDERLANFFETGLDDAERDRLLALPNEEMQRELQRLYLMRTRTFDGPRHRSEGFNPGDRSGRTTPPSTRSERQLRPIAK